MSFEDEEVLKNQNSEGNTSKNVSPLEGHLAEDSSIGNFEEENDELDNTSLEKDDIENIEISNDTEREDALGENSDLYKNEVEDNEDLSKNIENELQLDDSDNNIAIMDSSVGRDVNSIRIGDIIVKKIFGEGREEIEEIEILLCGNCLNKLDIDNSFFGKAKCSNCKTILYKTDDKLREFKTIRDDVEARNYSKVIAHIKNKIIDKKYNLAFQYCLKAEAIAPGEPMTWEYTAQCELLRDIEKALKLSAKNIIPHLEKCQVHGIEEEIYEALIAKIANHLFGFAKIEANKILPLGKDEYGIPIWSTSKLKQSIKYLNAYRTCYSLYRGSRYLEEAINELSKPYKWIVKDHEGNLKNMPNCGNFNAVRRRDELIKEILKMNPDYPIPHIKEERIGDLNLKSIPPNEVIILKYE